MADVFLIMDDFPVGKTLISRKPNEREMLDLLLAGIDYPPIRIEQTLIPHSGSRELGFDALVDAAWSGKRESFVVEVKTSSEPLILDRAILQAQRASREFGKRPMVFVTYLSEESLRLLEERQTSGIDLVGNALILGESFRIWRSGAHNKYRDSRPVQNPYRGDSSIFARCFLLQSKFDSLTALRDFALTRPGASLSSNAGALQLGTASKVVQSLCDEKILVKVKDAIELVDARRLLSNLQRRYRRVEGESILGKSPFGREQLWERLESWQHQHGGRFVATGSGSAAHHGVLFVDDLLRIYVDDLRSAREALPITEGRVFANIELIEEKKRLVYFDSVAEGPARWASLTQTWLELAQSRIAREQEASRPLFEHILNACSLGGLG